MYFICTEHYGAMRNDGLVYFYDEFRMVTFCRIQQRDANSVRPPKSICFPLQVCDVKINRVSLVCCHTIIVGKYDGSAQKLANRSVS